MSSRQELGALIKRYVSGPISETAVPGLRLYYTDSCKPTSGHLVYEPMVCVMVQGEKRVSLGSQVFRYTTEQFLIATVDLPVTGTVTNARPGEPYLALSLALDAKVLAELVLSEPSVSTPEPVGALGIGTLSPALLDAFLRLAKLMEEPSAIPQLAPLIAREIYYRLLKSSEAPTLRQIATRDSRASGIARAIRAIREGYATNFSASDLAHTAGMSLPSFNRHFRTVTLLSPLQYQKQIRLQEARRRLIVNQEDAATAGFQVGYSSPSQFSREYARTFGRPPREDAAWLRSEEGSRTDAPL